MLKNHSQHQNNELNLSTFSYNNIIFTIPEKSNDKINLLKSYFSIYASFTEKDHLESLFKNSVSVHKFIYLFYSNFKELNLPFKQKSVEFSLIHEKLIYFIVDYIIYNYFKTCNIVHKEHKQFNPTISFKTYEEFNKFLSLHMLKGYKKGMNENLVLKVKEIVEKDEKDILRTCLMSFVEYVENEKNLDYFRLSDIIIQFSVDILKNMTGDNSLDNLDIMKSFYELKDLFKRYEPPKSHSREDAFSQIMGYSTTLFNLFLLVTNEAADSDRFTNFLKRYDVLLFHIKDFEQNNFYISHNLFSRIIKEFTKITFSLKVMIATALCVNLIKDGK